MAAQRATVVSHTHSPHFSLFLYRTRCVHKLKNRMSSSVRRGVLCCASYASIASLVFRDVRYENVPRIRFNAVASPLWERSLATRHKGVHLSIFNFGALACMITSRFARSVFVCVSVWDERLRFYFILYYLWLSFVCLEIMGMFLSHACRRHTCGKRFDGAVTNYQNICGNINRAWIKVCVCVLTCLNDEPIATCLMSKYQFTPVTVCFTSIYTHGIALIQIKQKCVQCDNPRSVSSIYSRRTTKKPRIAIQSVTAAVRGPNRVSRDQIDEIYLYRCFVPNYL